MLNCIAYLVMFPRILALEGRLERSGKWRGNVNYRGQNYGLLKKASSKAAGSEDCEAYFYLCTLSDSSD